MTNEDMAANERDPGAEEAGGIDELASLRDEVAALKDQAMRFAAEAENTRRRAEREINDARAFAIQKFARDLHVEVRGRKGQTIVSGRQQHIAEDRNCVAPLHHALNVGQGFQQRSTFDRQLHVFVRCSPPRFEPPTRRVRKGLRH